MPDPGARPPDATMPRVLVIGAACAPDTMESHVMDALAELGWPAEFQGTDTPLRHFGLRAQNVAARLQSLLLREPERVSERRLVDAAAQFRPDLVLSILGNRLSPKTVAKMRGVSRAVFACWCQDQMTTLGRQYLLGAGYDHVFVKDRYLQRLFSSMLRGSRFHYLAEACNPAVHRPVEPSADDRARYGCDVAMIGSTYYYRQDILEQLAPFDLRIWGSRHDWMIDRLPGRHHGREVVLAEKGVVARSARIALNPLHYAEVDALNCRCFELAGIGAFQMVTDKPVLREHFEPDQEIVSFRDAGEMVEKVRHYLAHPAEAQGIASRGQARAFAEHTYVHRLREISRVALT
jgi:spore maturation protein CgeB